MKLTYKKLLLATATVALSLSACNSGSGSSNSSLSYKSIYSFADNNVDGSKPNDLVAFRDSKGKLQYYGTTESGGANGGGTVFSIDPTTGKESVVHSFGVESNDGSRPAAGLIAELYTTGTTILYGTTESGGANGRGTVFTIDPVTGNENVVYSFGGTNNSESDGANPVSILTYGVERKPLKSLYGTTKSGGVNGLGTIFSINPKTLVESVVYSFGTNSLESDGANPVADLRPVFESVFYGTTKSGGANGYGTVFSINVNTGIESVVHSFESGTDGANPVAGLTAYRNIYKLYGTTYYGGAKGCGTIYSFDAITESYSLAYSFGSISQDGKFPAAKLMVHKDMLYGTTSYGGTINFGTIFSINPNTLVESVLYSFGGNPDGNEPTAGLIDGDGKELYGTTRYGGANKSGTVFSILP